MKQEEELLLKDLCARLPYGVKVQVYYEDIAGSGYFDETVWVVDNDKPFHVNDRLIENIKPYLRPMSSMTEEELKEFVKFTSLSMHRFICDSTDTDHWYNAYEEEDWLLAHHFDYRRLIEKGLALEAPEGMYEI